MNALYPSFDVALADGRRCDLRIAVPPVPAPAAGWPVACVLDAHQFERMCADPGGLPGLLVGVAPGEPAHRAWDYTPRTRTRPAPPPGITGHAGRWLHALDQVRARVAADYPVKHQAWVLCAHSLGAVFGLYALTHRPSAFDGYVLSSPSVWWGDRYALRLLRRRREWLCVRGLPPLGIHLTVGEHEQGLGPDDADADPQQQASRLAMRRARGMVDGMWALSAELARCPGLRLRTAVLPGRSHRTAPLDALMPGWRWLLDALHG